MEPGAVFVGPNGEKQTLKANTREDIPLGVLVYNFTVDIAHTYFVSCDTDSTPVLVHNASGYAPNTIAPAKRNSGQTVLGRYPDYKNLSDGLGARRFDVPSDVWNRMSPAEQWAANQKFLDRTISRGDSIRLGSPVERATEGSFFRKELDYLFGKGYTLDSSGTSLLPPRR